MCHVYVPIIVVLMYGACKISHSFHTWDDKGMVHVLHCAVLSGGMLYIIVADKTVHFIAANWSFGIPLTFTSPFFPESYATNSEVYKYTFELPAQKLGSFVTISFDDWQLSPFSYVSVRHWFLLYHKSPPYTWFGLKLFAGQNTMLTPTPYFTCAHACMHARTHARTHAHTHKHTHTYTLTHSLTHTHSYTNTHSLSLSLSLSLSHTHMYTCTHAHT